MRKQLIEKVKLRRSLQSQINILKPAISAMDRDRSNHTHGSLSHAFK